MLPRAFVIMPFGRKPVGDESSRLIDFDRVYTDLLEPALVSVGYDVARADSEAVAGDIRTNMFFELVTADLVVADISINNVNVFYELGVRHGVAPGGVFIVHAEGMALPPFDVMPDRRFDYDAAPFLVASGATVAANSQSGIAPQCERLVKTFKDALSREREAIGSPVYSHLPGLRPANWENIETSKARYFSALRSDWRTLVKQAQARGRPGDILTLATYAPTRFHASQILYEAAGALTALSRYSAAERVLREVIALAPNHAHAQLDLARVLSHSGDVLSAEQLLIGPGPALKGPEADNVRGQALRYRWHFAWHNEPDVEARKRKARSTSYHAVSAIAAFAKSHRARPNAQYFAGFNALMLMYLLEQIAVAGDRPTEVPDFTELKTVVSYIARHKRAQATESGQYEERFWPTTTLAGIAFIEGKHDEAMDLIQEACDSGIATPFQLQRFRDRLELLFELGVKAEFVGEALGVVDRALDTSDLRCACERVFLWAHYPIRQPADAPSNATEQALAAVADHILRGLEIQEGDLGICGGTSEGDIICAETFLNLGGRVRLLMRAPTESESRAWPLGDAEWNARFQRLRDRVGHAGTWLDSNQLGSVNEGSVTHDPIAVSIRRHYQWLINTAEVEAEPFVRARRSSGDAGRARQLFGLFPDGRTNGDWDGISFLTKRVRDFQGYSGRVIALNPADTI